MKIEAHDISVRLGSRDVLRGVSLAIAAGEFAAIVGANGAGKSTLLRALARLVPAAGGSIAVGGRALSDFNPTELARLVAFLPQDRTVHWPLRARAIVALGRLPYRGFAAAEATDDTDAISRAMVAADVTHLADRRVTEVSGGELARVLMARTLAQEARFLIADEPASGLDPAHQLELFERLRALSLAGTGVLVAQHDLSLAARFCTRIVMLKGGKIIADGPPASTLTEATLATAYGIKARIASLDGVPVVLPLSALP